MIDKGIKGRAETTLTEALTVKKIGSGELNVYATPMLVALVEKTAWHSVTGELDAGQGTVGTNVNINHISATPKGMKVWCETELTKLIAQTCFFS